MNIPLDTQNTDRNYLYGRILGLVESVVNQKDQTLYSRALINEIRKYSYHPYTTIQHLENKTRILLSGNRELIDYFNKRFSEIVDLFTVEAFTDDSELNPLYLLGQAHEKINYTQRNIK